jgi:hypothetical protein
MSAKGPTADSPLRSDKQRKAALQVTTFVFFIALDTVAADRTSAFTPTGTCRVSTRDSM